MDFKNKVVLVTGASTGIGAVTAVHFASLGANLSLTGRNVANLKEVAEKCRKASTSGLKPLVVAGEMTKESDVQNLVDSTIKHFGKLDVLINNAGVWELGGIEDTDLSQYDRIMNTNVRGVYQLTMLAVPHLIKTKGNIINISSINGLRAFSGVLAYCLSKAALDQFTRCISLELAPKQVRVNSVNPGVIVTDIHRGSGMTDEEYKAYMDHAKEVHPLHRVGSSEECAYAIAFLASEASSNTTGVTLSLDGGRQNVCPR